MGEGQTYKPSDASNVMSVIREMCLEEVINLASKGMEMVMEDLLEEPILEPDLEG